MECSRCKKFLDKNEFTYKNIEKKIYYQYCINCRIKSKEYTSNITSLEVECKICSRKYIFRTQTEYDRHRNSKICKKHLENTSINKKLNDYYKYNFSQLRKICLANSIKNASKMSKYDIIKELVKIENVIIPDEVI